MVEECSLSLSLSVSLLDFTNNRFDHVPEEVCNFGQLVKLSFYRNLLRSVPEDLRHLENLKDLNIRCGGRERERENMWFMYVQ